MYQDSCCLLKNKRQHTTNGNAYYDSFIIKKQTVLLDDHMLFSLTASCLCTNYRVLEPYVGVRAAVLMRAIVMSRKIS